MNRIEFVEFLKKAPIIFDGATGTNLQKAGMPTGVSPEQWVLEHEDVMVQLQKGYVEAGADIVLASTFTGNRIKLAEYGLEERIEEINTRLVEISKRAVGKKALVAGDLTMTGEALYPIGELKLETLIDVYKEQVEYLVAAGVDLFVVETMMSLSETRAAVLAIKESCDLPIIVCMTYNEDGRTLYGTDPKTATVVLQSLGVDVIGVNCSTGPEEMIPIIKEMRRYSNIPIMAKPNAGLPELIDGETHYVMEPDTFAAYGVQLVDAGAALVGGCCGTTDRHIKALTEAVKDKKVMPPNAEQVRCLSSERKTINIDLNGQFMVVGERINPTGKKKLQEELRAGTLDTVLAMAEDQEAKGADILDINMGMNGIDEKEMMQRVIYELSRTVNTPLCIDSSHVEVIEAALRIYPGRALINSISLEPEKIEKLLPLAKKYGAMFILLPLSEAGLPKDIDEKIAIINTILDRALALGMSKDDIIVDGLVATVGANKQAALETLEVIRYCKQELGLCTICGLSNISFGLPERNYVNAAFVTMAIQAGLTMAIANPSQDLLINLALASDLLLNKKAADLKYINRVSHSPETKAAGFPTATEKKQPGIYECVLKGSKGRIIKEINQVLDEGGIPNQIIDEMLIPAINEVGELFNQQIYFLPQLISSAETMQTAIEYLEPMLERKKTGDQMPTVVIATVEGDIHDIGKNLVVLMLKNYGYNVIDLGKDVSKKEILETAVKENAQIIGLSALMTTTMMRMKDVVEYRNQLGVDVKIIIGGAVITQSFADEIGADGYSKDAAEAVKLVQRILQ